MLKNDVPITRISQELDVARNTIYRIRDEKNLKKLNYQSKELI